MSTFSNVHQHPELDGYQFEQILDQLEREWLVRDKVARSLKAATGAFASQCTKPNGYAYMQTCDDLLHFLEEKVPLEHSEQMLVVQVLQVACAMHENAVNNPTLTPTERSSHYLATTSLVPLCRRALEGSVTDPDLWAEVFSINDRAEKAHVRAVNALDLSRYLSGEDITFPAEDNANQVIGTALPVPRDTRPISEEDLIPEDPHMTRLKHKALAVAKESTYVDKAAPLGRRHTLPAVIYSTPPNPYPSRANGARGYGLHTLQEEAE